MLGRGEAGEGLWEGGREVRREAAESLRLRRVARERARRRGFSRLDLHGSLLGRRAAEGLAADRGRAAAGGVRREWAEASRRRRGSGGAVRAGLVKGRGGNAPAGAAAALGGRSRPRRAWPGPRRARRAGRLQGRGGRSGRQGRRGRPAGGRGPGRGRAGVGGRRERAERASAWRSRAAGPRGAFARRSEALWRAAPPGRGGVPARGGRRDCLSIFQMRRKEGGRRRASSGPGGRDTPTGPSQRRSPRG